jgi:hypothetical protein
MAVSDEKTAASASAPLTNPLRQLLVGSGLGLVAIVAYYFYQLLILKPDYSFGLLRAWGPWWVLAVLACYFAWELLKMAVAEIGKMADGVRTLAVAVSEIAARDDRQFEEMQRLTQYGARQSERLVELLTKQGVQLAEIVRHVEALPCCTAVLREACKQ